MRQADHVDFVAKAHTGFFEVLAKETVDEPDGRKVLHAGKTERLQLIEVMVHNHERIGAVYAGKHGSVLDYRQHFARHVDDDLISVTVCEQSRKRAAARHSVAARVVNNNEIDATGFFALGR